MYLFFGSEKLFIYIVSFTKCEQHSKHVQYLQLGLWSDLVVIIVVQSSLIPLPDRYPGMGHRNARHPAHPVQVWRSQGQASGCTTHRISLAVVQRTLWYLVRASLSDAENLIHTWQQHFDLHSKTVLIFNIEVINLKLSFI